MSPRKKSATAPGQSRTRSMTQRSITEQLEQCRRELAEQDQEFAAIRAALSEDADGLLVVDETQLRELDDAFQVTPTQPVAVPAAMRC